MATKQTNTPRGGTKLKDKEQAVPKGRGHPRKASLADAPKATKAKVADKKQGTDVAHSPFVMAVQDADAQFALSAKNAISRLVQSNEDLYRELIVLKNVYLASQDEAEKDEVEKFLKSRKVKKPRKGTNPAYPFAQAFFEVGVRDKKRERISQYGKAAWVLASRGQTDEEDLVWLTGADDDLEQDCGLRNTLKLYKKDEKGKGWTEAELAAQENAKKRKKQERRNDIAGNFETQSVKYFATFGKNQQRKERAGEIVLLAGFVKENGELELSELHVKEDQKLKLISEKLTIQTEGEE